MLRPRDLASLGLVAASLTFSMAALGGAPRWAAGVGALLCLATAVPYVTSRRTASTQPALLLPIAVAAALTALGLLPLPSALAQILAPAKLELVTLNNAAWGESSPAWVVPSYDPPATLLELAKYLGYLALAWTCCRLAAGRKTKRWLAKIVVAVGALAALITVAHEATGATALYGMHPSPVSSPVLGPLINMNHLASLLGLGVPVALALAASVVGTWRLWWAALALALMGTTVLTASRGGVIAMGFGLVVAAAILVVQRRIRREDKKRPVRATVVIPAAVVIACSVILVGILTAEDVAKEFSATSVSELGDEQSKYQIWMKAGALVSDNHWFGVGKGGFEAAFTRVSDVGDLTYSHAENSYVQAIVDWGPLGAAALLLALLMAARAGRRKWREGPLEAGAIGAICGLAVHELADFSLEVPAVPMLAIAAAALLFPARLGVTAARREQVASPASRRAWAMRAGALAAAALLIALALSPLGREASAEAERLTPGKAADGGVADAPAAVGAFRAAWARHPADHVLAGLTAQRLFAARDGRAVPVVARALALNPSYSALHLLAARMLSRSQRPAQAAVELAAAARLAKDPRPIIAEVLRLFPEPEAAARALPGEASAVLRLAGYLYKQPAHALAYARRAAGMNPRDPAVHALTAQLAITAVQPEVAVQAGRTAWRHAPTTANATLLGRALRLAGSLPEARALLTEAVESSPPGASAARVELCFALAEVLQDLNELEAAKQTLERGLAAAAGLKRLAASAHDRLAAVEDGLAHRNQANWHREQAQLLRRP